MMVGRRPIQSLSQPRSATMAANAKNRLKASEQRAHCLPEKI